MNGGADSHDPVTEAGVDGEALDALLRLSPLQRFDQLVRTVRFIEAGRRALAHDLDDRG